MRTGGQDKFQRDHLASILLKSVDPFSGRLNASSGERRGATSSATSAIVLAIPKQAIAAIHFISSISFSVGLFFRIRFASLPRTA